MKKKAIEYIYQEEYLVSDDNLDKERLEFIFNKKYYDIITKTEKENIKYD